MKNLIIFISLIFITKLHAKCIVLNSSEERAIAQNDPLYSFLSNQEICPNNVVAFKSGLEHSGFLIEPAMVANRGRHNFKNGSFSFFETVSGPGILKGDFFFGHFTRKNKNMLVLDNQNSPGKLLIELIVWDNIKEVYNFYEMIGGQVTPKWFYRGDSFDILKDNKWVHRNSPLGEKKFGSRLRCSACHSSGGPIMKELKLPHNDWWTTKRPLPFGNSTVLSVDISNSVSKLVDANYFSKNIVTGINKLESSEKYQSFKLQLSLQEQLRPLFCENEINLESDLVSSFENNNATIRIPTSFLLHKMAQEVVVKIEKNDYANLLTKYNLRFPETRLQDADHPWLTPVKGFSDIQAINTLKEKGIIDDEFILDVLAVDFKNPVISKSRCELLKLIPEIRAIDWKNQFIKNLKKSANTTAHELLINLIDPSKNITFHKMTFNTYAKEIELAFPLEDQFLKLLSLRLAILQSEISQNPRGQILEPGFRVIFPIKL